MKYDNTAIPILTAINFNEDDSLKKDKTLLIIFYLKNESTNSNLLKTCKSSMPSPTPIYFTGI